MDAVGIIAEYNPFHNGHLYHITETRSLHPESGIVAIMSGNFTQRGDCALYDKWTRARMALAGGADLVLELPVCFATRSAAYFAEGGIRSLNATGLIHSVSFGVESENATELEELAAFLQEESPEYREALHKELHRGVSYPAARQRALESMGVTASANLSSPNNILALHYLQSIRKYCPHIKPILLTRKGSYHAADVPASEEGYASATAIRRLLREENSLWQQQVPPEVRNIIREKLSEDILPMESSAFDQILFALLRRADATELARVPELGEGLEHRILDAARHVSPALTPDTDTVDSLIDAVKTKRYTHTRIRRHLLHFLLNMTEADCFAAPEYLRVLGFNEKGQQLLKAMRKTAALPVITRPAAQQKLLTDAGRRMLALDCRATDLYYMGYPIPALRQCGQDYLRQPIQI